MKITEDLIIDLLPVYQSGEASKDTIKVVESYLEENPAFKKILSEFDNKLELNEIEQSHPTGEKEALMRVKRLLRLRSILLGVAIFMSTAPLSMAGNSEDGITWMMLRDSPNMALLFGVVAVVMWVAYIWTFQTLSDWRLLTQRLKGLKI